MGKAPKKLEDGRNLKYEEVIRSKNLLQDVISAAEFVDIINKPYKEEDGWIHLESSIQKVKGGYWVAVHQALYA